MIKIATNKKGDQTIKISKSDWLTIGKQAGWLNHNFETDEEYYPNAKTDKKFDNKRNGLLGIKDPNKRGYNDYIKNNPKPRSGSTEKSIVQIENPYQKDTGDYLLWEDGWNQASKGMPYNG